MQNNVVKEIQANIISNNITPPEGTQQSLNEDFKLLGKKKNKKIKKRIKKKINN